MMTIQKVPEQNIKSKNLPSRAVIIQLLDADKNHLAFIACRYNKIFPLFDTSNERETSNFLEEISNFEAEILQNYFQTDGETKKRFGGGWTGELILTDEAGKIFYRERPA